MSTIETARAAAVGMVDTVIAGDPLGAGKLGEGAKALLVELVTLGKLSPLDAAQRGKARERADMIAFLRKRQRAARTVADRNPAEAERATWLADQIGIEIEAIENALHEGEATIEGATMASTTEQGA
ncbi:hypothetical protein [Novosphingobium sp.]|uniref:hypothetical protein n=1 Tax=Novosphingobium sp. TaxID=1874826 RepID=UPI0038BBD80D